MDQQQLLGLYRFMVQARHIDLVEKELTNRGEAFFHLSGAGHEAIAALAPHLTSEDWLHCHYRDRALLLARGISTRSCFDNLFCNDRSPGRGRRMTPFMSDPALHILSMVTPTANNALQAIGVAAAVKARPGKPIVYCGVGDGSTQQGEYLEAVGEAVREELPVLFVIQDNRWAISTPTTGRTFFSLPDGPGESFFGLPIHYVDGRDVETAFHAFSATVTQVRETRGPALVVFRVERLSSHTNADDQTIYRTADDLSTAEAESDPIQIAEAKLLKLGLTRSDLNVIQAQLKDQVAAAEAEAMV
ncbi:MAG: thiamine pyrophosphate-dependent dehydrogenase E1 component subunit alpha, partial [Pirellulaceae bacterium]